MAATKRTTAVAVFADQRQADQAVVELKQAGFRDDQIGVAMRHDPAVDEASGVTGEATYVEEGAATGVLAGLGLGALAGLGVLSGAIPVVGPAIAAGTLGVIFSNAMAGATVAGLAGALIGYGIPEEEAKFYHGEFASGRTIVTVDAGARYAEVQAILRNCGGYDMDHRASMLGEANTSRGTVASGSTTSRTTPREGDTIQVKEERLVAHKQPVQTGEVTIRKDVRTETRQIDVPVEREEIVIERTPVSGRTPTRTLGQGEEIRIPVREDKVNLDKEAVVTEEVHVGKRKVQDTEHLTGEVRKEDVQVEQKGHAEVRSTGSTTGKSRREPR